MKRYFFIAVEIIRLFLIHPSESVGQKIDSTQSLTLSQAVQALAQHTTFTYENLMDTNALFVRLTKATNTELESLLSHPTPIIKVYVFAALLQRDHRQACNMLLTHLTDIRKIHIRFGCIGEDEAVADILVELLHICKPSCIDDPFSRQLIHKAIYQDSDTNLRKLLLQTLPPDSAYYERIRELTLQKKPAAVQMLAKYRNSTDIPLVYSYLADRTTLQAGLEAIYVFPDSSFLPLLMEIHKTLLRHKKHVHISLIRDFYTALMAYKNPETYTMIEESLSRHKGFIRQTHHQEFWLSLQKHPNKAYYQGLTTKIRIDAVSKKLLETLIL